MTLKQTTLSHLILFILLTCFVSACTFPSFSAPQQVSIPISVTPGVEKLVHKQTVVISVNSEAWKNAELQWSVVSDNMSTFGELSSNSESTVVYRAPSEGHGTITISIVGKTKNFEGTATVNFTVDDDFLSLLPKRIYSKPEQLTNDPGDEYVPSYSPSQESIVFMSNTTGNWQIYSSSTVSITQNNEWKRLTNDSGNNYHPRYSLDGANLAFSSDQTGDQEIFVLDLNTNNLQQITSSTGSDTYPSYTPDGKHIVFMSERQGSLGIYLMNSDGSNQMSIIDTKANEAYPAISPDGSAIVYQSDTAGNYDLYEIAITGGTPYRLTSDPARDVQPVFTRDGSAIIFENNREGTHQLYVISRDGKDLRQLTDLGPSSAQVPSISPDGKWIIFQSKLSGSWDIFRIPLSQ